MLHKDVFQLMSTPISRCLPYVQSSFWLLEPCVGDNQSISFTKVRLWIYIALEIWTGVILTIYLFLVWSSYWRSVRRWWGSPMIASWFNNGMLTLWQHLFESRNAAAPCLLEHQQNPPTTPVTPSIINDHLLHWHCIIFTVGMSRKNMHEIAMQGSVPLPREAKSRQFLYVQSTETSAYVAGLEPHQTRLGGRQVQSCRQKVSSLNLGQDLSGNFPQFIRTDDGIVLKLIFSLNHSLLCTCIA